MAKIDRGYPLVELHRHLDGNVRLETILEIGLQYNLPLPARTIEGLRPYVQVKQVKPDILAFFKKFEYLTMAMVSPDVCQRIAYENVEDAFNEGIDYIELRFSPLFMAEKHKLNPAEIVAAVIEGVKAGKRDFKIKVNLIGIISRTYGPLKGMLELEALLTQKEHIKALDLAGDEINYPGELFNEHFKKARNAGWHICPHAGEAAGPESVWQAIKELGAQRIGHAVHAVKDPQLLDYLADKEIAVESNITSNIQTSTVPDYSSHPIKTFIRKGILASINTDDPGISAIDIAHEYDYAAVRAGLTDKEIHTAQRNALKSAFLSEQEKNKLVAKKTFSQ